MFVFADDEAGADPPRDPIVADPAPDPIVAALQAKIDKLELEAEEKKKPAKVEVKKVRVSKYKAIHETTVKSVLHVLKSVKSLNKFELYALSQEIANLRKTFANASELNDVHNYGRWVSKKREEGKLSHDIGEIEGEEDDETEEEEDE